MAAYTQSAVRRPYAKVTANGTSLRWQRIEVVNTAFHQSDSFMVHLPLFDPQAPLDWTWWANTASIEIEVSVGFADQGGNPGSLTSLILGLVDRVDLVPLPPGHEFGAAGGHGGAAYGTKGAYLSIAGGDYTRMLMASPVSAQEAGGILTSQQIIRTIVENHPQLTLDIEETGSEVGSPYNDEQGRLFLARTEYDVISAICQHEGWTLRIQGKTVTIGPRSSIDSSQTYQISYSPPGSGQGPRATCIGLQLGRNCNIARGIKVATESYDSTTGAPAVRSEASTGGDGATYTQQIGGMTSGQTGQSAKSLLTQIAQSEREIQFEIPGDPELTIDTPVSLTGTGTAFDQTYQPEQIAHLIDVQRGYVMEAAAKAGSQGTSTTDSTPGASPLLDVPSGQ